MRRTIRCDHIDELVEAQERDEMIYVEHVCEKPLRHAGPLDDLVDDLAGDPADVKIEQVVWEQAVTEGEKWALQDNPQVED